MADNILRLGQFESKAIIALETRSPGIYIQKMAVAGNSILSTVFVESLGPGGSVLVEYFDYGVGSDVGEAVVLNAHLPVSIPVMSDRILVTNFHDKPYIKATVTGASVRFGVYASVVLSTASDIDSALKKDGEVVEILSDKGIPHMVYDTIAGVWRFATGLLGIQDVRVVGNVSLGDPGTPLFVDSNTVTTPGSLQTVLSYTVPALQTLNLLSIIFTCRQETSFQIYGDGILIGSGRTGAAKPNVNFSYRVARSFIPGKIVEVKATTRTGAPVSDVEAYLQGTLS
jgi:type III secretion system FlhB-like substrate exporter